MLSYETLLTRHAVRNNENNNLKKYIKNKINNSCYKFPYNENMLPFYILPSLSWWYSKTTMLIYSSIQNFNYKILSSQSKFALKFHINKVYVSSNFGILET